MEDNNVITLYKDKVQNVAFLVIAIIMIIFIIVMIVFGEPGPGASRMDLIPMSMIIGIFPAVFGWAFFDMNKQNKNRLFIKENGRVYSGKVLHVKVTKGDKKTIRKLLVEFFDGTEKKLIVSEHFPYNIDTVGLDLIKLITKTEDMEEYNRCYKENIIEHVQYFGNGYISFEKTEETKFIYKYNESKNKNYEGDLNCKVYEYDGKYVVDDFEGYEKEEIKKRNEIIKRIFKFWLIMMIIIIVILYKGYFGN